ncbi:radical SAM protein [Stenotrophomonas sp. MYb57]|uniref:cyclophane-forming radical SAM/SPASM peptide maturase YhhB n=1 Tax=Stenotrophomonas sp. MYb57 TaxID=1827305 RepID=UPI000CF68C08|nr:cyclophane-forming radical SAM/SPASM peptide maturase YhhB [Stenotrophomonas sp. MYb57]AVJ32428.1 radical SAM protein [Stenotrophomonas sp. MYb57]
MSSSTAQVDTVLLKVASRCNIDCTYCYVYNMGDEGWRGMPALMSDATVDALCQRLSELARAQSRKFAIVLHGGEPMMMGPRRLKKLLIALRGVLSSDYPIAIQSNGLLLTKEVLDVCDEADVSLSISIDGPEEVHDRFRVGKKGQGTHGQTRAGITLLKAHPSTERLFSGVLAVIDPGSSPAEVYAYLTSLGSPSIDFLYRDGNHSVLPYGKAAAQSVEYGRWLEVVLDRYLADPNPPKIRFLDDLIKLVLGGKGVKEGLGEMDYGILIVDTDGSITKNDTLKSTQPGGDRFEQAWSVYTHRFSEVVRSEEFARYHEIQRPTASKCCSCAELSVCGGGMPLHRWSQADGLNNPSVYCADQLHIIGSIRNRLRSEGLTA